ncbi:hypothetical protein B0T11DRAFT_276282 [Plectosphaerella cucumerina]|uniref:Uncharacterized protein n=1 Tax=Plectosphaerella cucumerina TaxID=40658 RepID=A0A8K0TMP9_9PEZI|nr:hypothetical protein B0T11DRAFT_276282 [Plectosphaerella cucumerina]
MAAQRKAEAEAAQRAAVQKAADIEAARRAADAEAVQRSIAAVTAQRALVKSAAQRIVAERAAAYNAASHRAAQKAADDVAAQKAADAAAAKKAAEAAAAAKKAADAVAAKQAADALAAQNAAEFEAKNMDLSVIPWPLRTIQCTDAQMWQDLEWRATTHPILMAATAENLPKLVQDVYDALDQVLKISGLVGNRGVRGLPLPIQDTMTCVSWLAEMATQAAAPSVFKMGAYALMNLAIGLKAYAAAYTTFGNVSAAAAPPGYQPNHASLAFAVWYGPDGWRIQEAILVAWDCWRVCRPMVQGSYGSWMWKDGSAWIRRMGC